MKVEKYVSPRVKVVDVMVEKGFAQTAPESGISDMPFGGDY